MAFKIQIVFDSRDPARLAKFWAAALHYKFQGQWGTSCAIVDPDVAGPRIFIQKLATPKPRKNRLHIDINASPGKKMALSERRKSVNAEVRRLARIGAKKMRVEEFEGEYWVVMRDPDGNEFCVQ